MSWVLRPRTSAAWLLVLACATGWLALSITGLAIVLQILDATGSSSTAGLAAGVYGLTAAFIGVPRARIVDRFGPRRTLPWLALIHATALGLFVLSAQSDIHATALIVLVAVVSASTPPMIGAARAQWGDAVPADELPKAYAFMAMLGDLAQVVGPPAAALLATAVDPAAGLVVTAVLIVLATAAVVSGPQPSDAKRDQADPHDEDVAPSNRLAIAYPGMLTIAVAGVTLGVGMGAVDLLVPVMSAARDQSWAAGVILGAYGVGGVVGSLISPGLAQRLSVSTRYIGGIAALVPVTALLVLTPPWWLAALILLPAGVAWGITNVVLYELLDIVVPKENATESWTWLSTAEALGIAGGAGLAGILAEQSLTLAFSLVPVALAVTLLISVARRKTLRPLATPPTLATPEPTNAGMEA